MNKRQLRYYFNYLERCNMCDSDAASHKILGKRLNQSQGKNPQKKLVLQQQLYSARAVDLFT